MEKRLYLATRKGLFTVDRGEGKHAEWNITGSAFLGDPVSNVLYDRRDGGLYAALNLGHFGVKLHRSHDQGKTWEECPTPKYPVVEEAEADKPDADKPPSLKQIWVMEAGGNDEPGLLWAGTNPGGLFRSKDFGSSW